MTIKKLIPGKIKKELRHFKRLYRLQKTRRNHKYALQRIRKKDRIKVAFFLVNESIWKYEKLYFLLQGDDRFEPVVFIRSEEHTSELQSRGHLVCRHLLEKKRRSTLR